MSRRPPTRAAVAAAVALLLAPAWAAGPVPSGGPAAAVAAPLLAGCRLAAQETPLARGVAAARSGDYEAAVRRLEAATRSGSMGDRVAAARALAGAYAATGAYEDALEALDRAARALPPAQLAGARGRVLRGLGRDEEALEELGRAIEADASDAIPARLERAVLWWERGERAEAYAELDRFIDIYNNGRARTSAELVAVAEAVRRLGRRDPALFHDAVRAYEEALAADPADPAPPLGMADLFLEKYDGGEARRLFSEVLAANPRNADALAGLAAVERFAGTGNAIELVDRALEVNPRSVRALTLLGTLELELGDEAAAIDAADRALAVNPRSREALAVRTTAHHFLDDYDQATADRRRAHAIDPLFTGVFTTAAEVAVRRGRYGEAVDLTRRAVALDSTAWDARALLGMNLLRTGDIEDARRELERAFDGDPFNVWSKNTLDLMDRLASFETRRTPRFELVLDGDEAALLAPYVEEVAEEAYDALSERYDYAPDTPVRVEVYPRHADFSVRTMGLPGLGALGVAFGNVLAMDSPSARDAGAFHWGSTLWHEIAHAVTLGRTRHRIPRWLTEGISVREERRSRPGWGGGVNLAFLSAFLDDRLLPIERINEGFVRPSYPGQVVVSYEHAGLLVEWIESVYGEEAIGRVLDAYADGRSTESVLEDVLATDPAAFDRGFDEWVRERYGRGLAAVASLAALHGDRAAGHGAEGGGGAGLSGVEVAPGAGADPATAVRRARTRPDDFAAQLAAGHALASAGQPEEAVPYLERAKALFPEYGGPGSPYSLLAEIRREAGDTAGAVAELRRLTALDETAYAANLELAALEESAGDLAGAAAALERALFISPYDPAVHDRLARLAERLDRPALEVRERRAVLALSPVDRAGALYQLGLALHRAGAIDAARRAVLDALEIAPSYAEAQDLLLELSGGGG